MDVIGVLVNACTAGLSACSIAIILFQTHARSSVIFETKLISCTLACFVFSSVMTMVLGIFPAGTPDMEGYVTLLGCLGMGTLAIGYFLYVIFIARFLAEKPSFVTVFIFSFILGGEIFLILTGALKFQFYQTLGRWTMTSNSLFGLVLGGMSFMVVGYSLIQLLNMRKYATGKNHRVIMLFIWGSVFVFLVPDLLFIFQGQNPNGLLNSQLPFISMSIGVLLFTFGYLVNPTLGFITFFRVFRLYIVNSAGLPLYSATFEEDTSGDYATGDLLAGAMKGITTLMEESVRARVIESIRFQNKEILLHGEEDFFVMVVAEKTSGVLQSCIEDFTRRFYALYGEKVKHFAGSLDDFQEVGTLVDQSFGILGKIHSPSA